MDVFVNSMYSVYELIGSNDTTTKTFLDTKVISKQYIAYYLYRIFCKYFQQFENIIPSSEIENLMKILRIPNENKRENSCYPLAGKMTNDEKFLDIIILTILDMLTKLGKYINTVPRSSQYDNFMEFIKLKQLNVIVQDLVDLQKLVPRISVAAIRPDYNNDNNSNNNNKNTSTTTSIFETLKHQHHHRPFFLQNLLPDQHNVHNAYAAGWTLLCAILFRQLKNTPLLCIHDIE